MNILFKSQAFSIGIKNVNNFIELKISSLDQV